MAVSGELLWVSDIDRILGISIKDRKARYTFTVAGAKFLNDTTVDSHGNVYVSDMMDNKIYKIEHKLARYSPPVVYLAGEALLKNPNGLTFKDGNLIIGQWGEGIKGDFTTTAPGSLIEISNSDNSSVTELSPAVGNIDGVELWGTGFIYSDYIKGTVGYISLDGKNKVLLTNTPTAADIGISPQDKLIFVPVMNKNLLLAYKIR
jgi:sugar lactone lactonase YvrE